MSERLASGAYVACPDFFAVAKRIAKAYAPSPSDRNNAATRPFSLRLATGCYSGVMEDTSVQKSCWGLTVKAVLGIAVVMALAWLIAGSEGLSQLSG